MPTSVKDLTVEEFERIVQATVRRTLDDYLEDLEALRSPQFLASVQEARDQYRAGSVTSIDKLMDG